MIITIKIKRIHPIHTFQKRFGELKALNPVYNALNPTYEHVRAKQIIYLDLQLIAVKSTQFPTHPTAPHSPTAYLCVPQPPLLQQLAPKPPALQPAAPQLFAPHQLQINNLTESLTEPPRKIPNFYWQPGKPIGAPVSNFRKITYIPLLNVVLDLDQALSVAKLNCAQDLHKQLIEFSKTAKVWVTVQVEYEPVNPIANKQPFEQYFSAAPSFMFKRDKTISAFGNPYIDSFKILKDRISKFNTKFIRDKSGLRFARDLQVTLKMVKYAPFEGREWQALPEFLAKKAIIINRNNN